MKFVLQGLEEHHTRCVTNAQVKCFHEDGVDYIKDKSEHSLRGFDTVVLALGYKNHDPLSQAAKAACPEVYVIGDAVQARRALEATREAFEAAIQI